MSWHARSLYSHQNTVLTIIEIIPSYHAKGFMKGLRVKIFERLLSTTRKIILESQRFYSQIYSRPNRRDSATVDTIIRLIIECYRDS